MVGFGEEFQQTPRAITVAPPSEVTFPPQVATAADMLLTMSVDTVGNVTVALSSRIHLMDKPKYLLSPFRLTPAVL